MPNLPVDVDSWGRSACYPQGSFYPLSDGLSIQHRRITKPDFRPCSTCWSRSQAPFCLCTLRPVSVRPEGTFGRLRYSFGGDRPSQTACLRGSAGSLLLALESQQQKGGIPTSAPHRPRAMLRRLPPILCICHRDSISSCSEAPWGLSVQSRVTCIFTGISISPGPSLRQCPNHYAFHAGRNLPDKEFRYLRTVIVTAAVYRGFNSELSLLLLTFRHRAGVSPYTSSFDLAETCVFAKQSPGPILCGSFEHSLFRSYGVNLPSSLTTLLPLALEFSSCPPVSVCGTGICFYTQSFSRLQPSVLPYSNFGPLRPGQPTPGSHPFEVSLCLNYRWLRNINRMCIGYAFRPDLSSRLTWSGRTFLQKP